MSVNPTHAIVIGGSIAGLLNARVLSDHFDHVTIIERDKLPEDNRHRGGTPQSNHLHAILLRGYYIMKDLFEGFEDDMREAGAVTGRWGLDNRFFTEAGWTPIFDGGYTSQIVSRSTLEWLVRRRVQALDNVSFVTETDVKGLLTDHGTELSAERNKSRITGVRMQSRVDRTERDLFADLIVDASGRRSKAPTWLEAHGFAVPRKTVITAHTGYASRWYHIPDDFDLDYINIACQPLVNQKIYRGAAFMVIEDNKIGITAMGANGDFPPTDEEGFLAFLRSLPTDVYYQIATHTEPISPIYGYRKLENQLYHYEALKHRPENFIVTGDAACAFNPIYGQGMSSAAMEAELLDRMLRSYNVRHLNGFAAKFQKRFYKLIQGPWTMSVTEDLRYPDVEGAEATFKARLMQKCFDFVVVAIPYDRVVTKCFFDVFNLLKKPEAFMMPNILLRVIWHNLIHRRQYKRSRRDAMSTSEMKALEM